MTTTAIRTPEGRRAHSVYLVLLYVYTTAIFFWLTFSRGHWFSAYVATWFASFIPMVGVGVLGELRDARHGILDPKKASWAFLGDGYSLPFTAAGGAYLWLFCHNSHDFWHGAKWWVISALVGVAASFAFRKADTKTYNRVHPLLLTSPTKEIHDRCAFLVLAGGLVYLAVPGLVYFFSRNIPYTPGSIVAISAMVVGLAGWVFGLKHDSGKRDDGTPQLDPLELHSPFNWDRWRTHGI